MNINSWLFKIVVYGFIPLWTFEELIIMLFDVNLNKFIGLPLTILSVLFAISYMINYKDEETTTTKIVKFFFIYNIVSVIWFLFSDVPIVGYIENLKYFICPLAFYFFGCTDANFSSKFYTTFGLSVFFILFLGLIWYIAPPGFYIDYIIRMKQSSYYLSGTEFLNEANIMNYAALESFVGLYTTSLLSIPLMAISFGLLFSNQRTYHPILLYLSVIIAFVGAILTFQRISIFGAIVCFLFFAIYGCIKRNNRIAVIGVLTILVVVYVGAIYYVTRFDTISQSMDSTLETFTFSSAMNDRTGQFDIALAQWDNILLGSGLGSASGYARSIGRIGVTDGEYVRILIETGIFGFIMFVFIIGSSIWQVIKRVDIFVIEIVVVVFFLGACVGANALSKGTMIATIFWFCLGRINNIKLINSQNSI